MNVTRVKYIATLNTEAADHGPRPLVGLEHLESGMGRLRLESPLIDTHATTGVAEVAVGDVLFGKLRPYLAKSWVADRPSFASTELLCLRPKSRIDSKWFGYLVASAPFIEWAIATSDGTKMPRTSWEKLGEFRVSVPAFSIQKSIAAYLDREIMRIDAIIAAKRLMVRLLKDSRQAAIDEALISDGTTVRLKHLVSRITSGPRGWADYASEEGVLFLRIANISAISTELDMTNATYVEPPKGAERRRTSVRPDDVLVSITAEIGSVGVARAAHGGAAVSQHVALLTPRRCSGDWLAYALCTSDAKGQQGAARYGGTKVQLSLEDVANISLPFVDISRQASVLAELSTRSCTIQAAQRGLNAQVRLLCERRRALITAAIAGQIDIPEAP